MLEVFSLPKMTKAQQKRMIKDIQSKAGKLFLTFTNPRGSRNDVPVMSNADYQAIAKICQRCLNRVG